MAEPDWRDRANCAGVSVTVFFHPEGERDPERSRREARAKAFCRGCPVRVECLQEALADKNSYGTWGGMSERERRNIRERRTVNVKEYLRLRAAAVTPATAAALTSVSVGTEAATSA